MPTFDTNSEPDFCTMDNATVDSRVRQDDHQQSMSFGRAGGDIAILMGLRELMSSTCGPTPGTASTLTPTFDGYLQQRRALPSCHPPSRVPYWKCKETKGVRLHPPPHVRTFSRRPIVRRRHRYGWDWRVLSHQHDLAAVHGPRRNFRPQSDCTHQSPPPTSTTGHDAVPSQTCSLFNET
ncbi:hypothetical protein BJV77DRAFT_985861 [Russula vinacea]|nr:hypothetical protein BJV77DRAFT_985861 [Russula vinacea]